MPGSGHSFVPLRCDDVSMSGVNAEGKRDASYISFHEAVAGPQLLDWRAASTRCTVRPRFGYQIGLSEESGLMGVWGNAAHERSTPLVRESVGRAVGRRGSCDGVRKVHRHGQGER